MNEYLPQPKPVPRLKERQAEQRADKERWQAVCREVDERDHHRCRSCSRRTRKTLTLCAERAEHHHVTPRTIEPSLKFDARNVVHLCCDCHQKITRHELVIEGPRFLHEGWRYLDASQPLRFVKADV